MIDIEQRLRRTFSSLAGNEGLSELPDETAASAILQWAEKLARGLVLQTSQMEDAEADEYLGPRLRSVRALMRAASHWAAEPDPAVRAEWWARVEQGGKALYGELFSLPDMSEVLAPVAPEASLDQVILTLRQAIENHAPKG